MNPTRNSHVAPAGYVLVPRWAILVAFVVIVAMLVLALFTFPSSPAAQAPAVAQAPSVAVPTLTPRTVTSSNRALGDPNAPTQLVEFSDFQ